MPPTSPPGPASSPFLPPWRVLSGPYSPFKAATVAGAAHASLSRCSWWRGGGVRCPPLLPNVDNGVVEAHTSLPLWPGRPSSHEAPSTASLCFPTATGGLLPRRPVRRCVAAVFYHALELLSLSPVHQICSFSLCCADVRTAAGLSPTAAGTGDVNGEEPTRNDGHTVVHARQPNTPRRGSMRVERPWRQGCGRSGGDRVSDRADLARQNRTKIRKELFLDY